MNRTFITGVFIGLVMAVCVIAGFALARLDTLVSGQPPAPTETPLIAPSVTPFELSLDTETPTFTPTETPTLTVSPTLPPSSPLPTLTASQTLKPPPTFEPSTSTPRPTLTPIPTATSGRLAAATFPPGLRGIESEFNDGVEVDSETCEKRDDWELRYTVQPGDALSKIATLYGTLATDLAVANCLDDVDTIVSGQVLRVPGDTQPDEPYVCDEWEVLTPFDGAYTIDGDDTISFVWRGPVSDRYLVRVIQPSGQIWEKLIDKQQNLVVILPDELREAGNHQWYVYPLGLDFLQIPCKEGGPWYFHKTASTIPAPLERTATAIAETEAEAEAEEANE